MKIALPTLIAAVAVAGVAFTTPADTMEGHTIVSPQDIKWGPAPAVLPPGAEAAVLFGDPSKEGLFVLRLKFPEGYRVAPHTHPVDEVVTVISGTFSMGMGETADQQQGPGLARGQFLRPSSRHGALCLHRRRDGYTNQHQRSMGTYLHQPEGRPAAEVAVMRDRALGSAPSIITT